MKESEIQAEIMKYLNMHHLVAWAYVTSTGTFRGLQGGRPIKIGYPGMADILGQMKSGKLFAIEVKKPGEKPRKDQQEFLDMVKKYGGRSCCATCIEDIESFMVDEYW